MLNLIVCQDRFSGQTQEKLTQNACFCMFLHVSAGEIDLASVSSVSRTPRGGVARGPARVRRGPSNSLVSEDDEDTEEDNEDDDEGEHIFPQSQPQLQQASGSSSEYLLRGIYIRNG